MNYAAVKCGVVEIEIHIQHNLHEFIHNITTHHHIWNN